jgi:hypothetical protein
MEYSIEFDGPEMVLKCNGLCPKGSKQNEIIAGVVESLQTNAVEHNVESIVLDFRHLDYSWGDAIASTWLWALRRGLRCRIRATGTTKEALLALMKNSIPVPIVE